MDTAILEYEACPNCGRPMLRLDGAWQCLACASPTREQGRRNPPSKTKPGADSRTHPTSAPARAPHTPMVRPPSEPAVGDDAAGLVGRTLGRYRLEALIGQGAMGAVYRALHTATEKTYAVKVLTQSTSDPGQFESRFLQEAQIAASIRHPGLVEVFDFGVEWGFPYYVMEYLEGETVADRIRAGARLPTQTAIQIVAAAAEAVAVAHDAQVVHRDLKPENLFLARDEDGVETVKVLDFGVSKDLDAVALTMVGAALGTPAYMSPEHAARRDVDGRSDIYSLGIVLYRLLAGHVPFQSEQYLVVLRAHLSESPARLSGEPGMDVSPELESVLFKALEKRPEDRFSDAREFAHSLREVLEIAAVDDASATLPMMAPFVLEPAERVLRGQRPELPEEDPPSGAESPPSVVVSGELAGSGGRPVSRRLLPWLGAGAVVVAAGVAMWLFVLRPGARSSPALVTRATAQAKPIVPVEKPGLPANAGEKTQPTPAVAQKPEPANAGEKTPPAPAVAQKPEPASSKPTPDVPPRVREAPKVPPKPRSQVALSDADDGLASATGGQSRVWVSVKMPGRVRFVINGKPSYLTAGAPRAFDVPPGNHAASFETETGASCVITFRVQKGTKPNLVLGPGLEAVLVAGESGPQALSCF